MKCLHFLMIIIDSFLGQHNPSNYFALTFQRRILAIYTQQKQKEGCKKTQSSFFTSPSFLCFFLFNHLSTCFAIPHFPRSTSNFYYPSYLPLQNTTFQEEKSFHYSHWYSNHRITRYTVHEHSFHLN